MKNIFISITFLLISCSLSAQSLTDAVRYSRFQVAGTARTAGVGGSFGAMGGDFGSLNIVTGPVLTENPIDYIGQNDVAVPAAYYKVLMTEGKTPRAVGFLMDNEISDKPLQSFMVTIDEIEKVTGIDFFNGMLDAKDEERLESYVDKKAWRVNNKRYKMRREKWNYN